MAEVVGAVASATQLAHVCLELFDLLRKIKGATSALRRYQQQLLDIRNLSNIILGNPLLQTSEIGAHTQTILLVDENDFGHRIQGSWFVRTYTLVSREREIVTILSTLEQHKSTLSLLIKDIQSRALHQIQSDIQVMAGRSSHTSKSKAPKKGHKSRSDSSKETQRQPGANDVVIRPHPDAPAPLEANRVTPEKGHGARSNPPTETQNRAETNEIPAPPHFNFPPNVHVNNIFTAQANAYGYMDAKPGYAQAPGAPGHGQNTWHGQVPGYCQSPDASQDSDSGQASGYSCSYVNGQVPSSGHAYNPGRPGPGPEPTPHFQPHDWPPKNRYYSDEEIKRSVEMSLGFDKEASHFVCTEIHGNANRVNGVNIEAKGRVPKSLLEGLKTGRQFHTKTVRTGTGQDVRGVQVRVDDLSDVPPVTIKHPNIVSAGEVIYGDGVDIINGINIVQRKSKK